MVPLAIIPLLLLLLALAGLIVGIVLFATGGRPGTKGEMACGACGYAVRGLESLRCPECGVDLRQAGIHKPKGGGSRTAGLVLTILCGGVLALVCLLSGFAFLGFQKSVNTQPIQPYQQQTSTPSQLSQDPAGEQIIEPADEPADEESAQ